MQVESGRNPERATPFPLGTCVLAGHRLETGSDSHGFPHRGARLGDWLQLRGDSRGVRQGTDSRARGAGVERRGRCVDPRTGAEARRRGAVHRPEPVQDEAGTGTGRAGGADVARRGRRVGRAGGLHARGETADVARVRGTDHQRASVVVAGVPGVARVGTGADSTA